MKELLIRVGTGYLSSFTQHPNTALHCFPEVSRVVSLQSFVIYKSINYPWNEGIDV